MGTCYYICKHGGHTIIAELVSPIIILIQPRRINRVHRVVAAVGVEVAATTKADGVFRGPSGGFGVVLAGAEVVEVRVGVPEAARPAEGLGEVRVTGVVHTRDQVPRHVPLQALDHRAVGHFHHLAHAAEVVGDEAVGPVVALPGGDDHIVRHVAARGVDEVGAHDVVAVEFGDRGRVTRVEVAARLRRDRHAVDQFAPLDAAAHRVGLVSDGGGPARQADALEVPRQVVGVGGGCPPFRAREHFAVEVVSVGGGLGGRIPPEQPVLRIVLRSHCRSIHRVRQAVSVEVVRGGGISIRREDGAQLPRIVVLIGDGGSGRPPLDGFRLGRDAPEFGVNGAMVFNNSNQRRKISDFSFEEDLS